VHSQDGPLDGAHVRAVAAILVPHNYTRVELGADLALLRLAKPARLGPAVRPVCLPRASHRFAHGTACWATGWGDVQEEGECYSREAEHMVRSAGRALKAASLQWAWHGRWGRGQAGPGGA
jgi:hypothetical protein